MGNCLSKKGQQYQFQPINTNVNRADTYNNEGQKGQFQEQQVSSQPQPIQNVSQNVEQQNEQLLQAKQVQNPNWNYQQPIGDNFLGNNEGTLSDAELARRQEEMLRENLAGDTTKPGSGILEMIQDSFNRLNKIIELLGPAYTKMPADDQQQ